MHFGPVHFKRCDVDLVLQSGNDPQADLDSIRMKQRRRALRFLTVQGKRPEAGRQSMPIVVKLTDFNASAGRSFHFRNDAVTHLGTNQSLRSTNTPVTAAMTASAIATRPPKNRN